MTSPRTMLIDGTAVLSRARLLSSTVMATRFQAPSTVIVKIRRCPCAVRWLLVVESLKTYASACDVHVVERLVQAICYKVAQGTYTHTCEREDTQQAHVYERQVASASLPPQYTKSKARDHRRTTIAASNSPSRSKGTDHPQVHRWCNRPASKRLVQEVPSCKPCGRSFTSNRAWCEQTWRSMVAQAGGEIS
jgi:hypothetical protein